MKKVIVIGDLDALIAKRESFLLRSDMKMLKAADNAEALRMHDSERADLIIAPLNSQKMPGRELCASIRGNEDLRNVSIIIVAPPDADLKDMEGCRTNALIAEPVNIDVLLEKAHQLLNIARRMSYRMPVAVKVEGKHKGKPFLGYSVNVSSSGMLLEAEKPIKKGDLILCSFIITEAVRIKTEADVVRAASRSNEFETNQYGIRFIELSEEDKEAIEALFR